MTRILMLTAICLLYQMFIVTSALIFSVVAVPLAAAPVMLSFGIFFQNPIEGLLTMLWAGFVIDVFSGMPIGVNIMVLFLLWFGCVSAASWLGKPRWSMVFVFVVMISVLYRILICGVLFLLSGNAGNFEWQHLLWAPFVDGLIGICIIRLLHVLMVEFNLMESMEDVSVRLSLRRGRINIR